MTTRQLSDIVSNPNGRAVHYFNGRILSAEDLSAEQDFNREERRALGRSIGEGIVHGLEVTRIKDAATPTLRITAGLAINRSGATLHLPQDVDVALAPVPVPVSTEGADFSECGNLKDVDAYVAREGLYLLTMFPVETREGSAKTSGLNNTIAPCNNKYRVKGIRFRRIQLPTTGLDLTKGDLLRNALAYACFGSEAYQSAYADLASPSLLSNAYGLIDSLRPNALTNCDVPLAVLYMTTSGGLIFVDMWSVRRRVMAPATYGWPMLNDRRVAEGEAMMMQFTDQIHHLREGLGAAVTLTAQAKTYFHHLPAAGVLPIALNNQARGFAPEVFFTDVTTRASVNDDSSPIFIEGARVEALLKASLAYPPIDLSSGVMVWLYRVRENAQGTSQPYLIFTSGHMPYMGDPHYDVNRYSFGVFA